MRRSIKHIYGGKLGATDGDIGHVLDFYFDEQDWVVRYLVVDTGDWLPGRKVLLSPHSLRSLDPTGRVIQVGLTRKRIEESPPMDSHKPLSRQYEEEYYRYYGWPFYWDGGALWGMSGFPILELPPEEKPAESAETDFADAHLRSTKAVAGYRIEAIDGTQGHVVDFLIDDQTWAIEELVVRIGHRLSGREVNLPTSKVIRISWEESAVYTGLTKEIIEGSPANPIPV